MNASTKEVNADDLKSRPDVKTQDNQVKENNEDTEENNLHLNCLFKQRVKKMQSKEIVSKVLTAAANDRFNMKKSRMESILGINVSDDS